MAGSGTARPLREHPYSGGSAMAVPFPGTTSPTDRPPTKKTAAKKATPAKPASRKPAARTGPAAATASGAPAATSTPQQDAGARQVDQPGPQAPNRPAPAGDGFAWGDVLAPPGSGDVAGLLLGLLVWGWVVLPFLRSGTTGVKDMWRAKFLNKGSDGSWLP